VKVLALALVALAGGGGSSYLAAGNDYDFTLANTSSTAWRGFYLVAPAGISFVGGTTGNEGSATCAVGPPNEIECGSLATNILPPTGSVAFVATTAAKAVCGTTFQLFVSFDGVAFSHVADIAAAAGCGAQAVTLVAPPRLRGTPRVGHTVTVTAPIWSVMATRVRYRWERCTGTTCTTIAGAAGPKLDLTRRDAGHGVRIVATATIAGEAYSAKSSTLAIR